MKLIKLHTGNVGFDNVHQKAVLNDHWEVEINPEFIQAISPSINDFTAIMVGNAWQTYAEPIQQIKAMIREAKDL